MKFVWMSKGCFPRAGNQVCLSKEYQPGKYGLTHMRNETFDSIRKTIFAVRSKSLGSGYLNIFSDLFQDFIKVLCQFFQIKATLTTENMLLRKQLAM